MKQIYNPYLPLNVYIPDGEPHVFGDRLYIYGSHDKAGGTTYCQDHYEVWSAPVDDLKNWRREGISYFRTQDPSNADDSRQLWAPDVTQGPDGRYYLYYCLSFYPEIGVAVSDRPEGPFEFYGHVHYPAHILGGKTVSEHMVFDPAVLTDEDGRVYLYYGFAPAAEKEMIVPELSEEQLAEMPEENRKAFEQMRNEKFGEYSMVMELEPDMVTAKEEPRCLIPGGHHTEGTGFEGHGFFEASSIRRINGRYYFIYSSHKSHELCYAVSDHPDRDFVFGGVLVSNGDIGLDGRTEPVYPLGNTHGSIVQVKDDFYVFYHRQTNGTEFSRQGCAEKIEIREDGSIAQVEITSCGLNGRALAGKGSYPASIACHLTDPTTLSHIDYHDPVMKQQVRVTEAQNVSFITGIKDGTTIGYKYFEFYGGDLIAIEYRGTFDGTILIAHDEMMEDVIGEIEMSADTEVWEMTIVPVGSVRGRAALYFRFEGTGEMDLKTIAFISA
ncbi:MAG: family 43 glycosylhydrolase [Solobacterium sp.]|nr:family 43 glycosylhydrolase [Solobacterium sp.]